MGKLQGAYKLDGTGGDEVNMEKTGGVETRAYSSVENPEQPFKGIPNGHVSTEEAAAAARSEDGQLADINGSRPDLADDTDPPTTSKPWLYSRLIVSRPILAFAITVSGHVLMIGVSILLQLMGYKVFVTEFTQIPIELTGQPITLRSWAWKFRNSPPDVISRVALPTGTVWNRQFPMDPLQVMYTRNDKNVFSKETLKAIKRIEDDIFLKGEYREIFCQLDKHERCVRPVSIIRYFDGTYSGISPVFNDTEFNNIANVIWEAYTNPQTSENFPFFLGNKSVITNDSAFSEITRSLFPFGYPNENISNLGTTVGEFVFERFAPEIVRTQENVCEELQVSLLSWNMFVTGAAVYGVQDAFLLLGGLCFIFILIWLQTSTLWVTFWAVFSIIGSFFGTNLIYRFILDFRYFSYFHLIGMFIILGIGADDIFVFFNTWKATGFQKYPSLAHRLSDCYKRAAVSMLVTSFTTMVAFFVTSLSPLLAARSFGIFTGLLVLINYISVIVFFPAVVITYHLAFEGKDVIGCRPRKRRPGDDEIFCAEDERRGILVSFFEGPYFRFVSHRIGRWVLLTGFVAVVVGMSVTTSWLRPDSEQVKIFKENTPLGRGWKLFFNAFRATDDTRLKNNIVWGLLPRNVSICHFSDYKCRGQAVWDERFDINLPEVQVAMREFCWKLKYNLTEHQMDILHIRRDPTTGVAEVHCFMENMGRFLKREAAMFRRVFNRTVDLSFPLTERKVRPFMELLSPLVYNVSALSPTFHRYFEVALSYWMTNRYTMYPTQDHEMFNNYLGEGRDGANTRLVEFWRTNATAGIPNLPVYGTKLMHVGIPVNLTYNFFGLGYSEGIPTYWAWEDYLTKELSSYPFQLRGAFQANDEQWHWLFVQQSVVHSAITGVGLGIGLALPVLILATLNVILGTVSTVIITATSVCVIGVIPLAGWKLGLLVSVNLCLVVGLSVDYIVHMSEGYHLSEYTDRNDKVRDTLGKMGVSVVSGATTTLGASTFMFFGHTQFFLQFAAFMFSTIGFATIFSLGLFPVTMIICGPQGSTGSLVPLLRWIKNRVVCRSPANNSNRDCGDFSGEGVGSEGLEAPPGEENGGVQAPVSANGHSDPLSYSNPCFQADDDTPWELPVAELS